PKGEGRGEGEGSVIKEVHERPARTPKVSSFPADLPFSRSAAGFRVSRITRTMAHAWGVPIYDPQTREPITPEQARAQALDKRSYDQNFECAFGDENRTLLSLELISAAERDNVGEICEQVWNEAV